MSGLFGIINIGLSALLAHRNALSVRSHNLANVDTPGYTRREAILGTNPPLPPAGTAAALLGGQYGTGVNVIGLQRAREAFLGIQARLCLGLMGRSREKATALRQVESVVAPGPGDDLSALLDRFWDNWEKVANEPEDLGLRYVLRDSGIALTAAFREQAQKIHTIRLTLDQGIHARVKEVNSLAIRISEHNRRIEVALVEGRAPNDLLDSRDLLLDRLSELTGALPANSEGGTISIYLDGRPIVQGGRAHELTLTAGESGIEIRTSFDGAVVSIDRGELGGILEARDAAIPLYLAELDALASALVEEVNAWHESGYGLDGETGREFFVSGSRAGDLALNPAILSEVRALAAGETEAPGDGRVALAIAALRTMPVIEGRTLGERAQSLLGLVGGEVASAQAGEQAQRFALEQIREQQQAIGGVSIDEEMTYLMMTQRAYEAAAQVVRAVDEMIKVVIDRLGA